MCKIKNITKSVILCLMALLFAGCQMEKDAISPEAQSVLVEMSVTGGLTKADLYEEATSAEKSINSLRIYAFCGDRLAGYVARQSTAPGDAFYMDLELPAAGKHDVDFYIIANEGQMKYENSLVQLSETMTRSQIEAVRFTGLASKTSLPMYCVQREEIDVDAVSSTPAQSAGHQGHIVLDRKINFELSRSLAKISVYAAKIEGSATSAQILSADLLSGGTRMYSYLFPQNDDVLNNVPSRANDRALLGAAVNVEQTVQKGSAGAQNPDNYDAVVEGAYIPEVAVGSSAWNVSSGNERAAVLHIEYTLGGQLRNGYVYLPQIERNSHLKVCILINSEGQIIINYHVADWEWDEQKMQDWFFDYPTHSYLRHNLPVTQEDLEQTPQSAPQMSETQPFIGYFQMTYPANDTWKPTLWGPNSLNCTVKVYRLVTDRAEELVFTSESPVSIPVSEYWHRIEVYPKASHMMENDQVNFSITYTPSGLEESEYILINGSYGHYYWPGSEDANYLTITMVN